MKTKEKRRKRGNTRRGKIKRRKKRKRKKRRRKDNIIIVFGDKTKDDEIQGAAIFLASAASNYMVGSMITVDGGWTAR